MADSEGEASSVLRIDASHLRRAPDHAALVAALLVAAATDLVWRAGLGTLAGAGLILTVGAGLLVSGRVRNPQAHGLVMAASALGAWVAVRASPWLVIPDLAAAAACLAVAASLAEDGTLLDLTVPAGVTRLARTGANLAAAPRFAAASIESVRPEARTGHARGRGAEVLRGALLALPVVAVLAALLASADAVFASMVDVHDAIRPTIEHGLVMAAGFVGMSGLVRAASITAPPPLPSPRRPLGHVEMAVVLGSITVLFAMFGAAQLVALSGGGRRIVETSGLTYAQYARSGFFQLVAVAAITLVVVLALRTFVDLSRASTRRLFVLLSVPLILLTLVIVFVALRRMDLYEGAYGLTMLRLYVRISTLWIGAVLVMTALWLAGLGGTRHWTPFGAVALALLALLALDVLNPEALVVRRNVEHARDTGEFDAAYATGLSSDAVPTLVSLLPRLDPASRALVTEALCRTRRPAPGGLGWNGSRIAAARALYTCRQPPADPTRFDLSRSG